MCSVRHEVLRPARSKACGKRSSDRNGANREGALAGVPVALPALTRALKLQIKAARVGFDWNDPLAVVAKIREEADEIEAELAKGDRGAAQSEIGDLLFAAVNLARHLAIDPEAALRASNQKFERRFSAVEQSLARRGKSPAEAALSEMDELWNAAKAAELTKPTGGGSESGA
jgi:nucleoside triphosphate diphosphatase